MTNPIDIDALRRLMEKATAGPIMATERSGYHELLAPDEGCDWYGVPKHHAIAYIDTEIDEGEQVANAALFTAAINALPSLLTELEALRAIRGRMKQPAIIDRGLNESPALLLSALKQAYEKVKEWPERRGDPMEVGGQGFMDLLALRNLVPDIIAALQPAEDCGEVRG